MAKLTMARQREILSEKLNSHNEYNLGALLQKRHPKQRIVVVHYHPAELGRMSRPSGWYVTGAGFKTDPDSHWIHHGRKFFSTNGRHDKPVKFDEAIAWASERYSYERDDWVKTPYRDAHLPGSLLTPFLAEVFEGER